MLNTNKLYDIFFIYHPADLRSVRRIDARMTAKGVDCQVSEAELGKTDEGKKKLKADILRSHLVAIVLSPQSAESQTCNEFIQYAVSSGKRLVSLIVDEDIKVDVHPAIAENPYIFFRQQDVLEDGIQKLLELAVANQHIKLHTEMLVYAHHWDQNNRAGNLLLPPERVHQARQWLADGAHRLPKPSPLQVEYIHASRRQKPAVWRSLSVYHALALAILIGIAVVIGSLQNAVANRPTATAATVETAADSVQTQAPAFGLTTAATASSAVVLADIAASVADTITQMAQTDTPPTATPPLAAPAEAESPAAARVFVSAAQTGAPPLLSAAKQALEAGDADLALVLALALDDPDQAYRILNRAAALSPVLALNDVSSLRFHPTRGEFALIPRSFDRVLVYDIAARTIKYELTDHEDAVVTLAYSPDGQFLVTGAQDGELVIRSGAGGAPLHHRRHQGIVTAIAMYPASNQMVTAGMNPMLVAWDLASGEALASYSAVEGEELRLDDLLVTADGSRIIAWSNAGGKSMMTQWSADTLDLLTADTDGQVYRGYDPGGQTAWSGGRALPAYAGDPNTGDLIFWDLASAQQKSRLTAGFNWSILNDSDIAAADSLAFITFQDGLALLGVRSSAGRQRAVLVNIDDGTVRRSYESGIAARIATADFISPQTILSAVDGNRLVLWSSEDGSLMREVGSSPQPLREVTVSAAGDAVLGQTNDGKAYLWLIDESPPALAQVLPDAVTGTALNASGEELLIASRAAAVLQNIDTQEIIAAFEDSRIARMNPSGSHFAVHSENSIAVYDAVTGSEHAAWAVDMDDIQNLALAPTGDHVLISARSGELWHLHPDSDEAQPLPASGLGPAWMTRFAADGSLFMTLHAESAVLWETATASPRQAYPLGLASDFPFSERFHMAFSPDGDKLYFLAQLDNDLAGLTVFSLNDSSVKRQAFVDVRHGELTANGEQLLLALSDHSIQIIDTASGEVLSRLIGHQDAIRKLHYQKQHSRLLSASDDNRLILWDVEAAAIDQQYVHPNDILDFSLSQDGQRILSRDSTGVYRLWQVESLPELLDRIQSTFSPRGLTCAERRRYNVLPLCEQPRGLER